jgi:hypothetical protein
MRPVGGASTPVRLDYALRDIAKSDKRNSSKVELESFELVWREDVIGLRDAAASRPGLADRIFDFLMPKLSDPTVMQGGRCIDLLEEMTADIANVAGSDEYLRHWGDVVLRQELQKYRLLQRHLNSLVGA